MKEKIRIVLCCIFLAIAVYSGFNIVRIQSEYKKGVDTYKEIDKYTIEQTAEQINEYLDKGLINIIGGCCGTTPEHIKAIVDLAKNYKPRENT